MTETIRKFQNKCPFCESEDLDFGLIEPVDEQVRQKITCKKCDKNFSIWSTLSWDVRDEDGVYL